ncbi:MAG: cytochrome b N-terminal domain-containing protein [Hyphomicrobiales bacterium]
MNRLTLPFRAAWRWADERAGLAKAFGPLVTHRVPRPVAHGRSAWLYIFGGATLTAFLLQVVTGVILATAYVPSTASAYDSLQFITHDATFGRILRGMHYFGASAMVILIAAHMVRVFLTGSFKFPRELNWLTGVLLFFLTLGMAFTGQLLRWDEDAVGSVFVAAEQAGRVPLVGNGLAHFILAGENIGAATLSRFFALHVFILPGLIFAVVGFHLFLVLHNGISEPPSAGEAVDRASYRRRYEEMVRRAGSAYFPWAFWREALVGLVLVGIIFLLALVFGPKALNGPPDPTNTQANPRPDWYLLWIFALLAVAPVRLEDWLIVLGPLVTIVVLVAVPFVAHSGERHLSRRPWAAGIVLGALVSIAGLLYIGYRSPWAPRFDTRPLAAEQLETTNPDVINGAGQFYALGCQYCHTVNGHGGIRGPNLTNVVDRLSDADLRATILTGRTNMPSYSNTITEEQLAAILAFLHSVNGSRPP